MSSAVLESQKTGSHFFFLQDKIEQEIAKSILGFGEKTKLRDACEYALKSGGKRFRPLLVLLIGEGLGHGLNVYDSALAVEFFHTASLIADDLPCMDNEEERRSKPSVHKVYGESIALLSSYSLICSAFEKIYHNGAIMRQAEPPFCSFADRACVVAFEHATRCAGILGATGGQFLDLFPPSLNIESLRDVIYKKTVTLFEVSFVFGWLFGGGDMQLLNTVKKASYHFGMAFQIADDIGDLAQDEKNQREINFAKYVGKDRAFLTFEEEMQKFQKCLKEMQLETPSFNKMIGMLSKLAHDNYGRI